MPLPDTLAVTEAWLRLTLTLGPTRQTRALLDDFGDAPALFAAPPARLHARVQAPLSSVLAAPPTDDVMRQIERSLRWLDQPDHHFITLADVRYPTALRATAAPPLALYVAGRPDIPSTPGFAIVGTRRATAVGTRDAYDYARRLAALQLPIVSGLATGIDAAAHEGALAAGQAEGSTIAVLGTGLARCYPAQHADLAWRIQEQGALVSEFALDAGPRRSHFPRRNRIVAGLVRGVLIVEASAQSGSLITARLATDAGRDVFAMPGSIHSPVAQGCNALIQDGAKLVTRIADITDEYPDLHQTAAHALHQNSAASDAALPKAAPDNQALTPPSLRSTPEGRAVWDAMGYTAVDMDAIIHHTGMTVAEVAYHLTLLELSEWVVRLPDGRYMRSAPAR